MKKRNAISWFEIPVKDLERAQQFYETILGIKMTTLDLANFRMRMFPTDGEEAVGGALIHAEDFYRPSVSDGPLLYLNANPDVQQVLDHVVRAGGKISIPKTRISEEYGYMAVIIDTEGNRIGLHSDRQP